MVRQGKSVKEVLRSQVRSPDPMDAYGRYLAEKGLRGAIGRRRRGIARPHSSAQRGDCAETA